MIPRTLFSSDHELFRDSVRKFLEQEAVPFHEQWEERGYIDRELWNKAGAAGMLCSHLPEEYGGMAADFLYSAIVIEEISRHGLSGIGFSLHSDIVAPYILHYGSEQLKQKYLPKLVSGEMVSLTAVEDALAGAFPQFGLRCAVAVITKPDEDKGEKLIAVTNEPKLQLADLRAAIKAKGLSNLCVPREIVVVPSIPKLGTGKTNHRELEKLIAA